MGSSIRPTVGRKVWVWVGDDVGSSIVDEAQPFDATILFVEPDGLVSVRFYDHKGSETFAESIELRDPLPGGDNHGPAGSEGIFATWMPYQVGQAKASEAKTPAPHMVPTSTAAPIKK